MERMRDAVVWAEGGSETTDRQTSSLEMQQVPLRFNAQINANL